jgi:hypothetical protein
MADIRVLQARELMFRFADRTGLLSVRRPRRYLWTDAFAVCNFLALWQATGDAEHRDIALRLVDQVHRTLGQHRPEDPRAGWLSGLPDVGAAVHPTIGGLRIGKPLPELYDDEPPNQPSDWDRDGQYFHYLTKWMHALDQVARATADPQFNRWARELADVSVRAFVYRIGARRRMYWKMSIDLSRPLVTTMGHHDPLDGLVTCLELQASASTLGASGPDLGPAIATLASMIEPTRLVTLDPLGLGALFSDAARIEQLAHFGVSTRYDLHGAIATAAHAGLRAYLDTRELDGPPGSRLPFRELGLAIGLATRAFNPSLRATRAAIEELWLDHLIRESSAWAEHQDINDVMLATSLVPDGYLALHGFTHGNELRAAQ